MSNLFNILNITSSGMYTAQTAVEVTSHNIANINTPGYSKQSAVIETQIPAMGNGLLLGRGSVVTQVKRNEDRFLNYQVNKNTWLLGKLDAQTRYSEPLEEIFNEAYNEGLADGLSDFFQSLQDLASAPEGQAERTAVLGRAKTIVGRFHMLDSRLSDVAESADDEIGYAINDVNRIVSQIAELNNKVSTLEGTGHNANDFRAQRTASLAELAELIDYSYFEDDNGMINVQVGNGRPLVEGILGGKLVGVNNPANGNYKDVYFEDANGNQSNITSFIENGTIAGAIDVRDNTIGNLKTQLDEIAYAMVTEFNTQHASGFNLNGATGQDFFTALGSSTNAAQLIEIDPAVLGDVNNIAAGLTNAPGDNQNANLLSAIENSEILNGGTWTLQDQYSAMVSDIGTVAQNAQLNYAHQESVANQVINVRESIAGVSLEEEMANLVKFQESYSASAKMFQAVSEMVQILMSIE